MTEDEGNEDFDARRKTYKIFPPEISRKLPRHELIGRRVVAGKGFRFRDQNRDDEGFPSAGTITATDASEGWFNVIWDFERTADGSRLQEGVHNYQFGKSHTGEHYDLDIIDDLGGRAQPEKPKEPEPAKPYVVTMDWERPNSLVKALFGESL